MIKQLLQQHYGLDIQHIIQRDGGWSALAYQVETEKISYFLKMYEKSRASTPKWTALIEVYIPVLLYFANYSNWRGKLPLPVLTLDGQSKCENEDGVFLLYEHIDGETIGDRILSDVQAIQLADILAALHKYDETVVKQDLPIHPERIKEDFALPFLPSLQAVLNDPLMTETKKQDVRNTLNLFKEPLLSLMDRTEMLSNRLRHRPLHYTLCHTDLHHWNLMSANNQLVLIDWEGLRLAPVEADWMFIVDKPYYEDILFHYRKQHPGFDPDPEILSFYQGRRRLEDIWEFIEQLLFDTQDEEEREMTKNSLLQELKQLSSELN